jgi:NADH-quinone oxidoreductase subunit H
MNPVTGTAFVYLSAVKILVVFGLLFLLIAFWTLVERRGAGFIQNRLGPNRVGPQGLFQPIADGLKNFFKEETLPPFADRALFLLAPIMAFIPAFLTFSVVPFAAPLPTPWGLLGMQVADLPVGFLFILAISSLGVYGLVLAGWSSNNKYALLGGLRGAAQLISYEIAMGLSAMAVLVFAGNLSLNAIIAKQQASLWFVLPLFLAFFFFLVAAFAETNRVPFDLPEAESELVAGYHTEYSAMKFAMFYLSEYSNMVTASGLMVCLFFGGWDIPFTSWDNTPPWTITKTALTFGAFWAKTLFFLWLYVWVRWTIPRFRFDQLMDLGWKVLLPSALAYVMFVAVAVWALERSGVAFGVREGSILAVGNVVLAFLFFKVLDRNRVLGGPANRRREAWHRAASGGGA